LFLKIHDRNGHSEGRAFGVLDYRSCQVGGYIIELLFFVLSTEWK
jgi:hypothetical protein